MVPGNGELAERGGVARVGQKVVEPDRVVRHERGPDDGAQVELDQDGGRIGSDA